jgi:hypothetical protein
VAVILLRAFGGTDGVRRSQQLAESAVLDLVERID